MFWIINIYYIHDRQILLFCHCHFNFLIMSFDPQKLSILKSSLSFFLLLLLLLLSQLRIHYQIWGHADLLSCFLIRVLVLIFRSLTHINIYIWYKYLLHSFIWWESTFPVNRRDCSSLNGLSILVNNQLAIDVFISRLSVLFHWSIFLPVPL